tara:strand:+ start:2130 stop:2402 length:273 start_codon:yes stop_codon:yes gene_type:complete
MSNTENQKKLDPREWKTFDDWMKEKRLVVMRGEKGTKHDGKYYFHRSQVKYSRFHPLYEFCNNAGSQEIDYAHRYGDKGWFLGIDWDTWD